MSAWKKLNQQHAFVTSYVAKKSWTVASSSIFDSASTEVQYKYGTTSSLFEYYPDSADLFSGSYNSQNFSLVKKVSEYKPFILFRKII